MSAPSFDPEAEQEVDFGRYVRLLAARWWLLAAGLLVGAVVGYAVALGGSQTFKATATLYLGQPYSASGNVQLQAAQTNPSTVRQIAHAAIVIDRVATQCKARPGDLRGGISTQTVSGNIAKNGQTPLVTVSVQAKKRRLASCAVPMITISEAQGSPPKPRYALTPAGQEVLDGKADYIALNNADLWLGGAHLTHEKLWRWDESAQKIVAW